MKDVRVDQSSGSRTIETELPPTDPWNGIIFKRDSEEQPQDDVPVVDETPQNKNHEAEPQSVETESPEPPVSDTEEADDDDERFMDEEDDDQPEESVASDDDDYQDSEEGDDDEPNPYYYLGAQLKKDGYLLDDFEPTEEVTGIDVYNAYRKKLEEELQPQIEQQVYSKLQEQGVNESDLLVARAIRQGVDVSMLSEATMHERFASLDDDADREAKISSIRAMYQSRDFKPNEIENLIKTATAEDDLNLDDFHEEAKQYHESRWRNFQQEEANRVKQQEQARRQSIENAEKLVQTVLNEQELLGEKISKDEASILRDAIYNPSDTVEWQGQKYSVTKLYMFDHELQTNPELKLWLFKKYLLKDHETDTLKKKVQKELEQDMLSAYEKSVKKDLKAKRRKQVKKQLDDQVPVQSDPNRRTYTLDLNA